MKLMVKVKCLACRATKEVPLGHLGAVDCGSCGLLMEEVKRADPTPPTGRKPRHSGKKARVERTRRWNS